MHKIKPACEKMLPMRTGTCSAVKARRKLRLLCIFLTRCMQRIAFNASQAPNLISAFFHKTTFFFKFLLRSRFFTIAFVMQCFCPARGCSPVSLWPLLPLRRLRRTGFCCRLCLFRGWLPGRGSQVFCPGKDYS